MMDWQSLGLLVGFFAIIKFFLTTTFHVATGVKAHVLSKLSQEDMVQKYGKWAVVTGGSDGIGRHYALELARRGMNIVLISRTLNKLNNVAKEIAEKHGVETQVIQADFSKGRQCYQDIEKQLADKEIGVLVNNVGVVHPHPMRFVEVAEDSLWDHVNVNTGAILAMTRMALPAMLERGKGAVVNFASIAARHPWPLMQTYAASKAFDEYFSEALRVEYEESGVTFQTITPAYVATNMTSYSDKINKPSLFVPSPETFARNAVATLGHTHYTSGYWAHGLQVWFVDTFMPRCVWMYLTKAVNEAFQQEVKSKTE